METLVGRKLTVMEYGIYAHRDLVKEFDGDWKEILSIGWDPSVHARITDRWTEKNLKDNSVRVRVDSADAMFALAQIGVGAALLPLLYADEIEQLECFQNPMDGFSTPVWILTHQDLQRNARVRAFMSYVYEGFQCLSQSSSA